MLPISEFAPPRTRVLVVDANDDLRLTLCECFETLNLAVSSARNGADAVGLLESKKHHFDIIFTDLNLTPGPSGLDVLKTARQIQPLSYIVVMTGSSTIDKAIQSIQYGAFDYLSKPFRLEEIEIIANRIRDHLKLTGENQRLSRRLESVTEKFASVGSRLDRIETLLGRLADNLPYQKL